MKYLVNGVEYTDWQEAQAAEEKLEADKKAKETAAAERKAEVWEVQNKANAYLALVQENDKKRAELKAAEDALEAEYTRALNEFSDKHDGYHLTYYSKDGKTLEFKLEEVKAESIEKEWCEMQKRMSKFWKNFFNI